ncbi:hypothetical protein DL546_000041 [Coniochaeta pulveracea]|uniref:HTH APSES-type domain-containing protein n=1 Tax=Coniochaeta pulveracea TaxID=177199 RepID=A0A420Y2P6_9PEZI|nr:hypothetical protein DL546_000041 [Coniochaeta pulveracea]
MVSLAALLNPAGSEPPDSLPQYYTTPRSSSPGLSYSEGSPFLPNRYRQQRFEKQKMGKDHAGHSKSKAKGAVNFPPFEDLDDKSLREIRRYDVRPFGSIQTNCRHIPYNSEKKDFFDKTGRESFEVFQYTFRVPNDETEYTVMWDYNVGLVRMTPFFKCCNYPKTTPAKMLNMNPGLRDITHSITGGSIMAQGYWMPFSCARAVCATFCHHISGALIPIFGPRFPEQCIPPDSPDHGRMCIDPAIVEESTQEAERFRKLYSEQSSLALSNSPRQLQPRRNNTNAFSSPASAITYDYNSSPYSRRRHQRFGTGRGRGRGRGGLESPYGTETDDNEVSSGPETGCGDVDVRDLPRHGYPYTPVPSVRSVTSSGWTPHNMPEMQPRHPHPQQQPRYGCSNTREQGHHPQHNANPWLSAVPRLPGYAPPAPAIHTRLHHTTLPHPPILPSHTVPSTMTKRPRTRADYPDTDHEYDGGVESQGNSPTHSHLPTIRSLREIINDHRGILPLPTVSSTMAERNAAMLLMNLSMTEKVEAQGTREIAQEVQRVMDQVKEKTRPEDESKEGSASRVGSTPETGKSKENGEESDGAGAGKRKRASSM